MVAILTSRRSFELSVRSGLPRKRWETQHSCLSHPETTRRSHGVVKAVHKVSSSLVLRQKECHTLSSLHHKVRAQTHSVEIGEVLIQLCVAEDGVTLTHSPQHALKGLHLHPLDKTRYKPTARRDQIRLTVSPLFDNGTIQVMTTWRSPQLGSKSLHSSASCHRVCLHGGELFILGTKSLMLIMRRNMFRSWQFTVTAPHVAPHEADVTFTHWKVFLYNTRL